ncbi:MAG TPA: hypothetical protein VML55_13640 [Planctomycetaceae bacterium]|nr:hypothetical protein [Planctomycetaceae bacterium]
MARDLGRHQVPIQLFDFDASRPAAATRYRLRRTGFTRVTDEAHLVDELIAFGGRLSLPPVLFPTSDAMVLTVAKHRAELEKHYRIPASLAPGTVESFVDKRTFSNLCRRHGIAAPRTAFHASPEDLLAAAVEFQFPLILKPATGHLWHARLKGAKLLVLHSLEELREALSRFGADAGEFMLQELVPGDESNIWVAGVYIKADGTVGACFTGRKLRQHPPDFGSASLAESCLNEEIERLSLDLLSALGFRGICGTEFKYDARDDTFKIIEINQRQTLWFGLIAASGIDINYLAYCDLAGLPCEQAAPQQDGVKWAYLEKDLLSALHFLRGGRLTVRQWLGSLRGIRTHAVMSLSDPLPFLLSPRYYLSRLLSRRKSAS